MNRHRFLTLTAILSIASCTGALAGCDFVGRISGAYRGPTPDPVGLTNEVVIIRSIQTGPQAIRFLADRVTYLEAGDPHDVNRVIRAGTSPDNWELVRDLGFTVGERVTISTRFAYIGDASDLTAVPEWPGHDFREYPIGVHVLTAIAR
ncbi:MAG TPA: hypothetical protein VF142_13785 [Longimicrobium sp.]